MIDSSIVWQGRLFMPGMLTKTLPYVYFSKSRALAYALNKKKLFGAVDYVLDPITIGDSSPAMGLVSALQKALKEEED